VFFSEHSVHLLFTEEGSEAITILTYTIKSYKIYYISHTFETRQRSDNITIVLFQMLITLDNKDVASLTLLGVSYRFLAADDENQC